MLTSKFFDSLYFLPIAFVPLALYAAGESPIERVKFQTSPFQGVCQDVAFLNDKDYKKDKEYWDTAISSCGAPIQVLPEGGFFDTMTKVLGSANDQSKASDFLTQVGNGTLESLDFNNNVTDVYIHCANHDEKWFQDKAGAAQARAASSPAASKLDADFYDFSKCPERLTKLRSSIVKDGHAMRVQLALMKKTAGTGSAVASALRAMIGSKLPGEKVALSAEEKSEADSLFATMDAKDQVTVRAQGNAAIPKLREILKSQPDLTPGQVSDPAIPAWVTQWYTDGGGRNIDPEPPGAKMDFHFAVSHYQSSVEFNIAFQGFSRALGNTRILAYLAKPNPSDADIAAAAAQLLKNGVAERAKADKLLVRVSSGKMVVDPSLAMMSPEGSMLGPTGTSRPMTDNERVNKLISLMKNGPVVAQILKDNPGFCQSAAGVYNYVSNQNTKDSVLVGAGFVAAGILTGGVAPAVIGGSGAVALSLASTVGMVGAQLGMDYSKYHEAKMRDFNFVHSDADNFGAGRSIADVSEFQEARNTLAIDVAILLPTSAPGVVGQAAKLIPPKYLAFLRQSVKDLDTPAMLASLNAKGISEAEAKALVGDLGSSDLAVAQTAARRLSATLDIDPKMQKLLDTVVAKNMLSPDARVQVQGLEDRLAKLSSDDRAKVYDQMQAVMSKVDAGKVIPKRADAMNVVFSASEFGVKDPVAVAKNINEWDEGLNNLAAAYDRAGANMKLPEIQKLATLEERQQAAFRLALKNMGVKDENALASMSTCALGKGNFKPL